MSGARRSTGVLAAVAAAWICVSLCSGWSFAAEPNHARRTIVLLGPGPDAPLSASALLDAVKGQVAELGLGIVGLDAAGTSDLRQVLDKAAVLSKLHQALAVFWFGGTEQALVIYLYEPSGPRLRTRRMLVSGVQAAAAEEIAVVIRSAASALLEGSEVAMTEVQLPPPSPPRAMAQPKAMPRPPPPTARTPLASKKPSLRLALAYLGTMYAAKTPWQSGAGLSVSLRPAGSPWFLGAGYGYFPPFDTGDTSASVRISRHPAELFAGLEFQHRDFTLATEAGVVSDYVERRTERTEGSLDSTPAKARWLWAASTRLRAGWMPSSRWCMFGSVGADFMLNRFDYVVRTPASEAVLSPLPARPRLEAGLMIGIW
jgi:hypothetical protein